MNDEGATLDTEEPVPVSATDGGVPGALSAIDSAPLLVPVACGVNVTVMRQWRPPLKSSRKYSTR